MTTVGGVTANMIEGTFIVVEATNTGDRSTTITHLAGYHYKSFFQQLRKKPDKSFVVTNPGLGQSLPHLLPPGGRWIGGIDQKDELEEMSRTGRLYCGIIHTSAKKPVRRRVVIPKNEKKISK